MENEYEILEIDKGERISKALRRAAIVCNSVSLALGLAICGAKVLQKKNDSKIIKSDYANGYVVEGNRFYTKSTIYTEPIAITQNGETRYCAPEGFVLGNDGRCYKIEYISYAVAPAGYILDEETYKCWSLEKLNLVESTYTPEEGYHLEQYEEDENYSYVVQDGYHLELCEDDGPGLKHNYLIKDGYHLEKKGKVHKDVFSKTLEKSL